MLDNKMGNLLNEEQKKLLSEFKNVILLILTVIDLIFIFLSTSYTFSFKINILFADYDFLVCVLLFIDLSYDFYTSKKSLKEFFIDDKNILAVISILPYDLLFRYFSIFRIFRFLKLIKIIRIYDIKNNMNSLFYFVEEHLFKVLFLISAFYILIASTLLIMFDNTFSNFGEALWFIIVTISTVGYGDTVPTSIIGKSLTSLTIIIGIGIVAILTAYLSAVYNEKPEKETRESIKEYVDRIEDKNKDLINEIEYLNKQVSVIKEENKLLHDELSRMNDNLEELSDKLK